MTYKSGGLIQALDFNNLVGPNTTASTEQNKLNTIWATGVREYGYGQIAVPNVSANTIVQNEDWANLINTMNNVATHQGTTFTSAITPPSTNDKIEYLSKLQDNLQLIYDNRNYAAAQGTTQQRSVRYTTSAWHNKITFVFNITFSTGDKARYFFNSGGQIKLNFTHAATGGINSVFKNLCQNAGTLVISAMTGTQEATIAGTKYRGVTQIGSTGTPLVLDTTLGYYALPTTNKLLFKINPEVAGLAPGFSEYAASTISVYGKVSGTQGKNGDAGSIISLTVEWEQIPNTENIAPGNDTGPVDNSTTTCIVVYPKSTINGGVLTNTWGTATIDGSVDGN